MSRYKDYFIRYLERNDIKYTNMDDRIVKVAYNCDNAKSIAIYVCFSKKEDGTDVAFKCFNYVKFKDSTRGKAMLICNQMNNKYKFAKFYIDKDNDIIVETDAVVTIDNVGKKCHDLVKRLVNIGDKAYPEFMRAVWG